MFEGTLLELCAPTLHTAQKAAGINGKATGQCTRNTPRGWLTNRELRIEIMVIPGHGWYEGRVGLAG